MQSAAKTWHHLAPEQHWWCQEGLGSAFLSQQHNTITGTEQRRVADYRWIKQNSKLSFKGQKEVEAQKYIPVVMWASLLTPPLTRASSSNCKHCVLC